MQGVFRNILVAFRLEIETVHLDLSTGVKILEGWCNHVDLLVHLDLLCSLVIIIILFLNVEFILDGD